MKDSILQELDRGYNASKTYSYKKEDWSTPEWEELKISEKYGQIKDTGVNQEVLTDLGLRISTLPDDWEFHPQVKKIYEQRTKTIAEGKGIDWGTAESLAFATLIDEGYHVRNSGQDVERGTFSHRHAVLVNQNNEKHYVPLNSVKPQQEVPYFQACNSHLSEYAVAGFEYGYS